MPLKIVTDVTNCSEQIASA